MSKPAPRSATRPEPGFYLTKLVSKGWAVPCLIERVADGYQFTIDGELVPAVFSSGDLDAMMADWLTGASEPAVLKVCLRGEPCDSATYFHRRGTKIWAREHSPGHPCLSPMKPIDIRLLRPEDL